MGWGDKPASEKHDTSGYQSLLNSEDATIPSDFLDMVEENNRPISKNEIGYTICSYIDNRKTTLVYLKTDTTITIGKLKQDLQGRVGIPAHLLGLRYEGLLMDDGWFLSDLPDGACVFYLEVIQPRDQDLDQKDRRRKSRSVSTLRSLTKNSEPTINTDMNDSVERKLKSLGNNTPGTGSTFMDKKLEDADIEEEIISEHKRVVEELQSEWELRKTDEILAWMREKKEIVVQNSEDLTELLEENDNLRQEVKNGEAKLEAFLTPMKFTEGVNEKEGRDQSSNTKFKGRKKKNLAPIPSETGGMAEQDQDEEDEYFLQKKKEQEEAKERRRFLIDAITYIIFVILFAIVVFTSRGTDVQTYYFHSQIAGILENANYHLIATHADVWNWMTTTFVDFTYPEAWYNGDLFPNDQRGVLLGYDKLIGGIRIWQVRGSRFNCTGIPKEYTSDIVPWCYDASYADNIPIKFNRKSPFTTFQYNDAAILKETIFNSELGAAYPGSGHFADLKRTNKTLALETINWLKSNLWIDLQTRAMFINFNVFNANINLFCSVTYCFEFPITGGVIPNSEYLTTQLYYYLTINDYVVLTFEILLYLFILYYIIDEIFEFRRIGWRKYVIIIWKWIDWINYAIFFVVLGMKIYVVYTANTLTLANNSDTYQSLRSLSVIAFYMANINAINSFLVYFKVFKYFDLSRRMTVFKRTLSRAGKAIIYFSVVFFIVFIGYTQAGYMAFSNDMESFRSMKDSFFTLFRYAVGDFNFSELETASPIFGPIYFLTFMLVVYFILLNFFVAILADSYASVSAEDSDIEEILSNRIRAAMEDKVEKILQYTSVRRNEIISFISKLDTCPKTDEGHLDADMLEGIIANHKTILEIIGAKDAKNIVSIYDIDGDGYLEAREVDMMKTFFAAKIIEFEAMEIAVIEERQMGTFQKTIKIFRQRLNPTSVEQAGSGASTSNNGSNVK